MTKRDKEQQLTYELFHKWKNNVYGPLSDVDIRQAMYSGDIFVSPFSESNLTPLGYNFCPSEIIVSTRTKLPLSIHVEGADSYVLIRPRETVLISTREYLAVSEEIIGTFHSRVRVVSQGFGHISTTLDPCWKGPLLISLNNPTSQSIPLYIKKNGKGVPFVTLIFYHLSNPAGMHHDNPANRIDILTEYTAKPPKIMQLLFSKYYEQYIGIIERLSLAASRDILSNIDNDILDESEYILKSNEIFDCDYDAISRIDLIISKIELAGEKYSILKHVLQSFSEILQENAKAGFQHTPEYDYESYESAIKEYRQLCLKHVLKEKYAYAWFNDYSECTKMIKRHKVGSFMYRIIFSNWRNKFIEIVTIIILLGLTAFTVFKLSTDTAHSQLYSIAFAAELSVFASLITSILFNGKD